VLPDPYGEDAAPVEPEELRCEQCGKLLAEVVTPPYRIRCARCRFTNES